MTPKENYEAYSKELGKHVLKALLFFFFWLPLGLFVLAYLWVSLSA